MEQHAKQQAVEELLKEFGWYPSREIDITDDILALKEYNVAVHPAFTKFMKEFGGLIIENDGFACLELLCKAYIDDEVIRDINFVNTKTQQDLLLIGSCHLLYIFIDADGSFYSFLNGDSLGGRLFSCGNNWIEFFYTMCIQSPAPELPSVVVCGE